MAELAAMGPYRFQAARLTDTHKVYVLQSQPEFPRLIVLEPLTATYEDNVTRWNMLYPLASKKPNARYIGEVYQAESTKAVREALEPQNIRFAYPGDTVNGFYTMQHLTFTFMSDFTYNRVGYVDVDLDDLDALGLGETITLTAEERGKLDRADALQAEHGINGPRARASTTRPPGSWPVTASTRCSSTSRWCRTTSGAPTTSTR